MVVIRRDKTNSCCLENERLAQRNQQMEEELKRLQSQPV